MNKIKIVEQALLTLYRMLNKEREHLNYLKQEKFKDIKQVDVFIINSLERIMLIDNQIKTYLDYQVKFYEEYLDKLI